MTLLMMHLNDPVPDLRQLRPETPPALVTVIEKALAKDRDERFQSAAEMATALRAVASPSAASPEPRTPVKERLLDATVVATPSPSPKPVAAAAGSRAEYSVSSVASRAQIRPNRSRPAAEARAGTPQSERSASGILSNLPLSPGLLAGVGAGLVLLLILAFVLGGALSGGDGGSQGLAQGFASTPTLQAVDDTATVVAQALMATATAPALAAVPSATTAPTDTAEPTATEESTDTPVPPTATRTPTPQSTATAAPTATERPATPTYPPVATSTPTLMPTDTPLPGPYARINRITVQGDGYVVEYETIGFTETFEQWHTHFFFNTVYPDQAGLPGAGPWKVYYGPSPFTEYKVSDRPAGATQMCVRVANADHSLYYTPSGSLDTGNCANLP
jgi:hypothetical protein